MNNDLISRSALMQSLRGNVLVEVTPNLEQAIAEQPAAYDVDKVAFRLECESINCHIMTDRAVEIVKSGGSEGN